MCRSRGMWCGFPSCDDVSGRGCPRATSILTAGSGVLNIGRKAYAQSAGRQRVLCAVFARGARLFPVTGAPQFRDLGRAPGFARRTAFRRKALQPRALLLPDHGRAGGRHKLISSFGEVTVGVLYRSNPHLRRLWRGVHPLRGGPGVLRTEGVRVGSKALPIVPSVASADARVDRV